MRVMLSCSGAFHSFQLAEQLARAGVLDCFVTSYPKRYLLRRFGVSIPLARIRSTYLTLASKALQRLRVGGDETAYWVSQLHDARAAHLVREGTDIVVGWSGSSLRTLRRAKRRGAIAVVVRGSAHIEEQMAILSSEYQRCGLHLRIPHRTVAQELREYGEADYIQTNSTFVKRSFLARGFPDSKIIMCNTGVNMERFRPFPKRDRVFRFVYAGSCSIRKGTHLLLEAFASLRLPDTELLLIGDLSPEIEPLLRRWNDSVRHVPRVPQDEVAKVMSQGNVFVIPSLEEGLAAVQAQAMACGLPLLCTTNTGGEDLLSGPGAEGIVVPAGDVGALAAAMLRLHADPERTIEMGRRALERARSFTWETYGQRITACYRAMVSRTRSH